MDKKKKSYRVELPPLVVYFDEIEEIIDCLKELSTEISIETENYSLSDISELKEINKNQINQLEIRSRDPYISVDLGKSSASIYISEDNAAERGVLEKIRLLLERRKRKLAWLAHSSFLSGATTGASSWFFLFGAMNRDLTLIMQGILLLALGVFWMVFGHKNQFKQYSIIFTSSKEQTPGFLVRKKDDIIVALISGSIGALITYFLTR